MADKNDEVKKDRDDEKESVAENARKAAEKAKDKAEKAEKEIETKRGKKINSVCIRDCIKGGVRYKKGSKGPAFYGQIDSPHFVESKE